MWSGLDDGLPVETATVDLGADGLRATGVQIGADPVPYRVDYDLDATDAGSRSDTDQGAGGFGTRRLTVRAVGAGWSRALELTRSDDGRWACTSSATGHPAGVRFPSPGTEAPSALTGASDCDLGLSPLTNAMPVLRHGLHRGPGARDLLTAWVSVPDLAVRPYPQRYEHVGRHPRGVAGEDAGGSVVRFVDGGLFPGFVADLDLDADGFVVFYPHLARRR